MAKFFFICISFLLISVACEVLPSDIYAGFTPATELSVITTNSVDSISLTSARCGGYVHSNGEGTLIAYGVCWDTTTKPTIDLNTKTPQVTAKQ